MDEVEKIAEIEAILKKLCGFDYDGYVNSFNCCNGATAIYEAGYRKGKPRLLSDREQECPHIQRKLAGDETYDICEINTKPCLIEHGLYECETWNEIKAEIEADINYEG